ncbi:MAG: hypothetical protein ACOYMS_15695, partial [Terrimicrobiaceae bacterium]
AIVGYRLLTRTAAQLVLELITADDKILAASTPQNVVPGRDLASPEYATAVITPDKYTADLPSGKDVFLRAVLYDPAGGRLKQSAPAAYFTLGEPEVKLRVEAPSTPPVAICGKSIRDAINQNYVFHVSYSSLASPSALVSFDDKAKISLATFVVDFQDLVTLSNIRQIATGVPAGKEVDLDLIDLTDIPRNAKEFLVVAIADLESGEQFRSKPYVIGVECIQLGDSARSAKLGTTVSIPVSWNMPRKGTLTRNVEPFFEAEKTFAGNENQPFLDVVPINQGSSPDLGTGMYRVKYSLSPPGQPVTVSEERVIRIEYQLRTTPPSAKIPKGRIDNANKTLDFSAKVADEIAGSVFVFGLIGSGAKAPRSATADPLQLTGIHRTWDFGAGIGREAGFSAELVLEYDPEVLPSHPGFDASKLEVIAYDPATGIAERLPSRVDIAGRTVTATVDRIAPIYTLAVNGPLGRSLLGAPALSAGGGFQAGLAAVNPDEAPVQVAISGFNPGRIDVPLTLAPGQQVAGVLS